MLLRKRKTLICLFSVVLAAAIFALGVSLLAPERHKSYAADLPSEIYREISPDGTTLTMSGNSSDEKQNGCPYGQP